MTEMKLIWTNTVTRMTDGSGNDNIESTTEQDEGLEQRCGTCSISGEVETTTWR